MGLRGEKVVIMRSWHSRRGASCSAVVSGGITVLTPRIQFFNPWVGQFHFESSEEPIIRECTGADRW